MTSFTALLQLKDLSELTTIDMMKYLENRHWFYLDYICDHWVYEPVKYVDFIARVFKEQDIDMDVNSLCREYERWKKNIPTAGGVITANGKYGVELLTIRTGRCPVYAMPKGKQEVGETLIETARREVREETGLDIDFSQDNEGQNIWKSRLYFYHFKFKPERRLLKPQNPNEITEIKWHPLNYINDKPDLFSRQVRETVKILMEINRSCLENECCQKHPVLDSAKSK